jgi:hypothetical protein
MGIILKRIGLILMITHACAINGMEKHNWWQNGPDADPTPPTRTDLIRDFVALRIALLPTDVAPKVWSSIAEGLMSAEFSINDAEKVLERYEDEQDRIEEKEWRENRRFSFFYPSDIADDEVERS